MFGNLCWKWSIFGTGNCCCCRLPVDSSGRVRCVCDDSFLWPILAYTMGVYQPVAGRLWGSGKTMMTSWHENTIHITGPLCGNPPVPSQRASNWGLWCFLLSLTWASCWTHSRVNCQWFEMPWRWCNDTVISPLKFGIKSHNFFFVGLFKHYPWIGLHVVVDVSSVM